MAKDVINLAIVGCGGIAGAHLNGYDNLIKAGYDRFRFAAVVDPNEGNTAKFQERIKAMTGEAPPAFASVESDAQGRQARRRGRLHPPCSASLGRHPLPEEGHQRDG